MMWGPREWHTLLRTRPSAVPLASMLWPTVILGSLIAATAYFAVWLDGQRAVLSFIVFSPCFPGTSKLNLRDRYFGTWYVLQRMFDLKLRLPGIKVLLQEVGSFVGVSVCPARGMTAVNSIDQLSMGLQFNLRPNNLTCK